VLEVYYSDVLCETYNELFSLAY